MQARINEVKVPSQSISETKDELKQSFNMYGHMFKDRSEFEFFWMLPLSDKDRRVLVIRLLKEKQLMLELSRCTGKSDSSSEHRSLCISCCELYKQKI